MKIINIKFERKVGEETLTNLPKYEYEILGIDAGMEDEDADPIEAINRIKNIVYQGLGMVTVEEKVQEKKAPAKKAAPKKEEVKEEVKEEEVVEEVKEEKPKATRKSPAKNKTIDYDREVEEHKTIYVAEVNKILPDWHKKKETAAKVKAASLELEGTEFLNADGEVLDTFVEMLKKALA